MRIMASVSYKIEQQILSRTGDASSETQHSSNLFAGKQVIKVGIQAPPNFIFSFGGNSNITMGYYGVYELDLTNIGTLTHFSWQLNSLNENEYAYLDYVYQVVEQ